MNFNDYYLQALLQWGLTKKKEIKLLVFGSEFHVIMAIIFHFCPFVPTLKLPLNLVNS